MAEMSQGWMGASSPSPSSGIYRMGASSPYPSSGIYRRGASSHFPSSGIYRMVASSPSPYLGNYRMGASSPLLPQILIGRFHVPYITNINIINIISKVTQGLKF